MGTLLRTPYDPGQVPECAEAAKFTVSCTASAWASRRLIRAVFSILESSIRAPELLHNLHLAMTEASANVVRHAYKDTPPGKLSITLTLHPYEAIELEISDWGQGIKCRACDVHNVAPDSSGGRGLFIMSKLVDTFDIRRDQGKNTIYLLLRIGKESWRYCE